MITDGATPAPRDPHPDQAAKAQVSRPSIDYAIALSVACRATRQLRTSGSLAGSDPNAGDRC
jgi:hypothetical protein